MDMDKEREGIFESGYSEEELDKQANKLTDQNQVKAVNIFDASKKKKDSKKED
jgi:hypothetical protein